MSKTVHEYFALSEDEYKVTIVSYNDIHSDKYFPLVELALQKYDLRELKILKTESFNKNPEQFPNLSFGTLYFLEAYIGQMPRGMYEQLKLEISQTTRLSRSSLYLSEDGKIPQISTGKNYDDEALLSTAMRENPKDKAYEPNYDVQELVGQKSVHSIMKAMEEERAKKESEKRKVAETKLYRTTHNVLKEHTGTSFRKGIYEFRIVNGEVVVEGMNNESNSTLVNSADELKKTITEHVPSFSEKYGL